jgi:type II secretory pathway component PulF
MKTFSTKETIHFLHKLSFLIQARMSLTQALEIIIVQSHHKNKETLLRIQKNVTHGQSLAQSLESANFPFEIVHVIRAGEASGELRMQLTELTHHLESHMHIQQKLMAALLYPCLVVIGTIFLSLFLLVFIFPKVTQLFTSLHITLPLSTRIILWLSKSITSYGIIIVLLISLMLSVCIYSIKKYPRYTLLWHTYILKIPYAGSIIKNNILSTFFATLSLLLKSGIHIEQAITYAYAITTNLVFMHTRSEVHQKLLHGKTLSQSLATYSHVFPHTVTQLIEIGEYSRHLPETLEHIATELNEENERTTKKLLTLIEPALMLILGLIVGLIAVSIISPIYEITQNIHH